MSQTATTTQTEIIIIYELAASTWNLDPSPSSKKFVSKIDAAFATIFTMPIAWIKH